jgi:iron complex transport system substrate-binding protein
MAARSKRLIYVGLAVAAILIGARLRDASAGQAPVRDASARQAPVRDASARQATRIVSLVPALTEMLFAVGAGPQVVAVSSYDEFPPEVKSLPQVGALLDPDMERILSLRPDLVVIYGSQTDLQAQLGRAGIRVYNYRHAGLEGILNTLRDLGAAVGHATEGERLAREIRSTLDRLRARVQGRPKPRVLLVFERDPASLRGVFVSGGFGFLDDMLAIAGGVNVFADVKRESVQPSVETILARAPDVILEVRATGLLAATDVADARRVWRTLASIPAVRNGRIHILNGEHLVVPGPRVAQGAEGFARALHPDAFK